LALVFLGAVVIAVLIGAFLLSYTSLTLRGGIRGVYSGQERCLKKIRKYLATSHHADILCVSASHIIPNRDGPLFKAMVERGAKPWEDDRVRILFLDPESPYVEQRATEIGDSPEHFSDHIQSAIRTADELKTKHNVNLEYRTYSELPIYQVFIFQHRVFFSFYFPYQERYIALTYECTSDSPLGRSFMRHFNHLWKNA
jgi:hypothetical protein